MRNLKPIERVPGLDYDVLDELLGYRLRRAQVAMFIAFHEATKGLNITPPRFTALVVIGANPGIRQTVLGNVLGIARSGAMLLTDWFEDRGLVERRPCLGTAPHAQGRAARRAHEAPRARPRPAEGEFPHEDRAAGAAAPARQAHQWKRLGRWRVRSAQSASAPCRRTPRAGPTARSCCAPRRSSAPIRRRSPRSWTIGRRGRPSGFCSRSG